MTDFASLRLGTRRRPLVLLAALALHFAISGYTGCQDQQYTGTKYGGEGTKSLRLGGRTDTSNALVTVQVLKNPTLVPDNTSGNWTTLSTTRGTTTPLTWNDDAPYYDWGPSTASVAHGTSWPLGGVLRLRTFMQGANGPVQLVSFDDDYASCSQQNASQPWQFVGLNCMTRYPRSNVTHIVSTARNPAFNPEISYPEYLTRKYSRFTESNLGRGYYTRIGYEVPSSVSTSEIHDLAGFKSRFNLGDSNDVIAYYYNRGDLGLGREMHCGEYVDGSREGVACYVTNYRGITDFQQRWGGTAPEREQPAVNDAIARRNPLATVAMVYQRGATEAVKFIVFNGRGEFRADDQLSNEVRLDEARLQYFTSFEPEQLPSNCAACHGGAVSVASSGAGALTKVYFLPFDPQAFRFSTSNSTYSRANQEEAIRKLNALVLKTNVPARIRDLVNKWYGGDVSVAGRKFDNNAVPDGWLNSSEVPFAENLYKNVFEPYCQGCHMTQETFAFATAKSFVDAKAVIIPAVCGNAEAMNAPAYAHRMPHAEATLFNFWTSGARAHLMAALDARGACN